MLSPSEYEHLCDQLITLYDDLDNAIINDMVKRMMKTGKVTEATAWQAKQLQQSGMLYEDILEEIAKRTNATRNQVRTLFEDAGVQSIRNDNRSYKAAGLETIVKMSDAALQTLNAGYKKCMGDLSNLTLTTANTSQTAYIKACNLAYMEVTSGTMDYGTAIRRAVQSAADEGSWILYPSGHRDRLDVAVRRSVLTGVGQTVRKISEINANDMDCDIMEITAHAGARPSHAEWQGQFASLSGKNAGRKIDGARVYSLKEIGYGTGDGFGGWNCRHDWFPFFEGISSRAYSNQRLKDLNAKNIEYNGKMYSEYEIDQMQRALERKVRERKRAVSAADTAVKNAPDDQTANQMKAFFTEQSVKLKQAEKNLSDFINATGNLPDGTRTWVNGFGRSTAQKAVWANRKAQSQPYMAAIPKNSSKGSGNSGNNQSESGITKKNSTKTSANTVNLDYINSPEYKRKFRGLTGNVKVDDQIYNQAKAQLTHRNGSDKEDMCLINSETGKIEGRQTSSQSEFGVDYNDSLRNAIKDNPPYTLISIHNHPTNNPPTADDLISNGSHKYKLGIVVTHDGRVYIYKVGNKPFLSQSFSETVDKYRKLPYNLSEQDAIAKTLDDFKERYGIEWSELK